MKNQSRILKNGSHPTAVSQPQKHHAPPPKRGSDCQTFIFQNEAGTEIARVDFPRAIYRRIKQACKAHGWSTEEFFLLAIEPYLGKANASSQSRKGARQ